MYAVGSQNTLVELWWTWKWASLARRLRKSTRKSWIGPVGSVCECVTEPENTYVHRNSKRYRKFCKNVGRMCEQHCCICLVFSRMTFDALSLGAALPPLETEGRITISNKY
jgi:hypothetical protein